MKKIFLLPMIIVALFVLEGEPSLYAAHVLFVGPTKTTPHRDTPVVVGLLLDNEGETLSGISGSFSFPTDMFEVTGISDQNSIASLWVTQPSVSLEKTLDGRTHITFEGIFPGGYSGVKSPYYQGSKPGMLFSVKLYPKNEGRGTFVIDDLIVNRFSSQAEPVNATQTITAIEVPHLEGVVPEKSLPILVSNQGIQATITYDDLINNKAWYVFVSEKDKRFTIDKYYVAETDSSIFSSVTDALWRPAKNPYVLLYQDRTKYVHVKVVFSDNTYTVVTLPPVENSQHSSVSSRILSIVALVVLIGALLYEFFFGIFFRSKAKRE